MSDNRNPLTPDDAAMDALGVPRSRTPNTHGDGSRYWRFNACGDCDDPNCAEGDSEDATTYVRMLEQTIPKRIAGPPCGCMDIVCDHCIAIWTRIGEDRSAHALAVCREHAIEQGRRIEELQDQRTELCDALRDIATMSDYPDAVERSREALGIYETGAPNAS